MVQIYGIFSNRDRSGNPFIFLEKNKRLERIARPRKLLVAGKAMEILRGIAQILCKKTN